MALLLFLLLVTQVDHAVLPVHAQVSQSSQAVDETAGHLEGIFFVVAQPELRSFRILFHLPERNRTLLKDCDLLCVLQNLHLFGKLEDLSFLGVEPDKQFERIGHKFRVFVEVQVKQDLDEVLLFCDPGKV